MRFTPSPVAHCFELYRLEETIRTARGTTTRFFLEPHPDAAAHWDEILARYDQTTSAFMMTLSNACERSDFWPWAVVAFPEEYRLAGHVLAARPSREAVTYTNYTYDGGPPPETVSVLLLRSRAVLEDLAAGYDLFRFCAEMLRGRPSAQRWLCLSDPLPADWLAEAERRDPALFAEQMGSG